MTTNLSYEEAKKLVQAEKPKENYMILPFGYDTKFVVPYKDGVAIITALANAEVYEKSYSSPTKISPIEVESFSPTLLSKDEYQRIKMAMLLQVNPDDLKKAATP